MKRKYMIIVFLLIIAIIGFVIYIQIPEMKPIYNIKKIANTNFNNPLFLKSMTWGITYDSKVIVLSTNDEEEFIPDSTKDYVYKGASFLFYRFSNDSLLLYVADKTHIPELFNSQIKIKQIELDNPAMMNLKGNSAFVRQGLTEFN